jgi:hypothetical protein
MTHSRTQKEGRNDTSTGLTYNLAHIDATAMVNTQYLIYENTRIFWAC